LVDADETMARVDRRTRRRTASRSRAFLALSGSDLRHGHAHTLREAILAPGHSALAAGERGSRSIE
jgi:hypothetical protein